MPLIAEMPRVCYAKMQQHIQIVTFRPLLLRHETAMQESSAARRMCYLQE